ncbi:MAG: GGDEF domain-containing protein, partial [Phycisphaerales bacterium]
QRDALVVEMSVDGLTGIYNRRFFDDQLHERFEQARRFRGTLGLLMIDVDHFKSINDDHGHPVGDLVLKECAARMGQIMRRGDVLCRYGGEEFVVLLPGATKREIATVAERLRIRVEDEPFLRTLGDQSPIAVTISVGGALATPDQDSTEPCDLLHAADGALYQAKREGRNQSCFVVADRMRQQDAA